MITIAKGLMTPLKDSACPFSKNTYAASKAKYNASSMNPNARTR